MAEKTKRTGPSRSYPDAVYALAFNLYRGQNKTAIETAALINAKELCDRIDSTQVAYLAKVGESDTLRETI